MTSAAEEQNGQVVIKLSHAGKALEYSFDEGSTLNDLSRRVAEELSIPELNQKFLISPKPGLVRPPFEETDHGSAPLESFAKRRITLMGSTQAQIDSVNKSVQNSKAQSQRRVGGGPIKAATPAKTRDWKRLHDETTYTFLQIKPLPYLPNPERSTRFLERLRDDPGIKASMAKHQWSVPLLTEMNPAEHTTHDGRTLGLNRNAGEVIELRLRTDAYDGYRDYKTIRKTLCHELAHNVHGEHDRNFWDLCHQIEREVEQADWKSGGRALTDQEYYEPSEEMVHDHGGWTGGEYVLGTATSAGSSSQDISRSDGSSSSPMSRREILARAAEERAKKTKERGNAESSGGG